MNNIKTGGSAFPESGLSGLPNGKFIYGISGMTLRDYFAAKAMAGDWARAYTPESEYRISANFYYAMADAMIEAREKS